MMYAILMYANEDYSEYFNDKLNVVKRVLFR